MGKETVRFRCQHCLHCCTDVVCLPTPWDVIQLVKGTGENPYEFLEFVEPDDVEEVAKNDPTWLRCNGKRYIMALRRYEGTGCHFLDQKTRCCRAYTSRPILCRLFPFKLHETRDEKLKGFSLHKDVGCPKSRDGIAQTKPLYELYLEDLEHQYAYDDLVLGFNRRRDKTKRPEDFIELFVAGMKKEKPCRISQLA